MADKPIPFSAPMIQAVQDGRKTQTRRVLNPQPYMSDGFNGELVLDTIKGYSFADFLPLKSENIDACTPYQVGDRLWVREAHFAWGVWITTDELTKTGKRKRKFVRDHEVDVMFNAAGWRISHPFEENLKGWYPRAGMFMHRADSRITLPVTGVKVERLQHISEADAIAEGVERLHGGYHDDDDVYLNYLGGPDFGGSGAGKGSFRTLWNSINGPDAWGENPWVAAYTFTVSKRNIDNG